MDQVVLLKWQWKVETTTAPDPGPGSGGGQILEQWRGTKRGYLGSLPSEANRRGAEANDPSERGSMRTKFKAQRTARDKDWHSTLEYSFFFTVRKYKGDRMSDGERK